MGARARYGLGGGMLRSHVYRSPQLRKRSNAFAIFMRWIALTTCIASFPFMGRRLCVVDPCETTLRSGRQGTATASATIRSLRSAVRMTLRSDAVVMPSNCNRNALPSPPTTDAW